MELENKAASEQGVFIVDKILDKAQYNGTIYYLV